MDMVSQAEFARQQGWSRSYVTQLKQEGRLVMVCNGKKVDPVASVARINASEDPNRDDVRQRHAAERVADSNDSESPENSAKVADFQYARARKEEALADLAEAHRDKELESLVLASDVSKVGAELGTHIRVALENLIEQLAFELSPVSDVAELQVLLTDRFEFLLDDVSQHLRKIAGHE